MTKPIKVSLRNEPGDAILNRDVLTVSQNVINTCVSIVAVDPPLGLKPFVVQQAPDDIPRACLNGLPTEYWINVTCLNTRNYAQLAFQLGHELGHFFVDPHHSNWFIESLCTAFSFVTLDALAVKWTTEPPFPNWKDYASKFAEYRREMLVDALRKLCIPSEECLSTWIRQSLGNIITAGAFGRTEELLCADIAAKIMKTHVDSIQAITLLGAASKIDGKTNFEVWRRSVSALEAAFVTDLEEMFATRS